MALKLERKNGEGFSLLLNESKIIEHSSTRPAFALGSGRSSFYEKRGNFRVRERNLRKKSLRGFEVVTEDPDCVELAWANGLRTRFVNRNDHVEVSIDGEVRGVNRFWIQLPANRDEYVYGAGEQFSYVNLRGHRTFNWVTEPGVGRGRNMISVLSEVQSGEGGTRRSTYFPLPAFLTSRNLWFHSESFCHSEFDFRLRNQHVLKFWGIPRKFHIGLSGNAQDALGALSSVLGRQPLCPDWVRDGYIIGMQGGREVTDAKIEAAQAAGIRIAGIWCQDWEGIRMTSFGKQLFWDWKPDDTLYGDLKSYVADLNARGIRFLGYINPFLALEGPMYKEASAKGYCVKNKAGQDYHVVATTFPAALLDLSNPDACEWVKTVIKENMIDIGFSGWMADYAEYLPTDAVLFSGEDPLEFHNRYPVVWARLNREAIEERGKQDEVFFFVRSGYSGTSRFAVSLWAGDQLVNDNNDDGLPTVVRAGLSSGLSGINHFHGDLGGFTTVAWIKRDKETLLRWADLAAFMPAMRSHEGNRPGSNHQYDTDEETLRHLKRMTDVFVALKPYARELERDYQERGLPAIRHLFLHYPEQEECYVIEDQYLYGPDLLVAPVLHKNRKGRRVFLPEDRWIDLWTGRPHAPGRRWVSAPLGKPPVFYRADSRWLSLFRGVAEV